VEWRKDSFLVSDDPNRLDVTAIHQFLISSYWAEGRKKEVVEDSIRNSFSLGLYQEGKQIGFARAVTDFATFAYLCDVYVLPEFRKQRLGHFLMECLFQHPKVSSLKWLLKTTSSQSLYKDFEFKEIESAFGWMIRDRR
jgi:N-acetylglutamate synthase-like GNAT family acetyltransferase